VDRQTQIHRTERSRKARYTANTLCRFWTKGKTNPIEKDNSLTRWCWKSLTPRGQYDLNLHLRPGQIGEEADKSHFNK
jgi:hypothetical protein